MHSIKKIFDKSFVRYFIIGFLTVTIDFGLLQILVIIGVDTVYANLFSVLSSVIFNFFMQNYWSFKAGSSNKLQKSVKYIFLTTLNYLVNTYGFFLIYRELEMEGFIYNYFDFIPKILPDGFLVKILITGAIMSWNFFLFKYWVFKVNKNLKDEL